MRTIAVAVTLLLLAADASAVALDRDPAVLGTWSGGDGIYLRFEIEGGDGHVYCTARRGTSTGLAVFDIGDPLKPRLVSLYESPIGNVGGGSGLIVSGGLAYMNTDAGLLVVDVRDPYLPRQLGATATDGEEASDFCLAGEFVYLAHGGLTVIDVSDPEKPAVAGSWQLEGANAWEVVVSGTYAYVGDAEKGLRVLDVSDPSRIRQLVHYDDGGRLNGIRNVVFFKDHVYFQTRWGYFRSIGLDVSEPANPKAVYVGAETVPPFIAGDLAYCDQAVVDLSDPTSPRGTARWGNGCGDIFVSGTLGFVSDKFLGLCVLDLSSPATPERVGRHIRWFDGIVNAKDRLDMLRLVGDRLYTVSSGEAGLGANVQVFDVTDPASPRRLGATHLDVGSTQDMCVAADHLYVTYYASVLGDPRAPGMVVVDVHDPEAIDVVGVIEGTTFFSGGGERVDYYSKVLVFGDYAYVDEGPGDLLMLDVSRPDTPRIETGLVAHGRPFVTGGHVYAENPDGKLVDVTDPLNPGSPFVFDLGLELGPPLWRDSPFVASDGYAYVNRPGDRLSIFDIRDVTRPELAGELELSVFTGGQIQVVGDRVFVGSVEVIDVSDRTNPRLLWRRSGREYGLLAEEIRGAFFENLAYIPSGGGFEVIDLSVAGTPLPRIGICETSLAVPPSGIVVDASPSAFPSESFLFTADQGGGMRVFDVSRPEKPERLAHYESVIVERYLRWVDRPRVGAQLVMSGELAFIAWRAFVGTNVLVLEIIDVSNPAEPELAGIHERFGGFFGSGLAISGNRAYIGTYEGFEIVDVGDPERPSLAGEYVGALKSVEFARGDHVFVSTQTGFDVIDASDASAPEVVSSNTGFLGPRLGDLVYASREILDISDPVNPRVVGNIDWPGPTPTVIWGDIGFAYQGDSWVRILDLSDPLAPRVIGTLFDRRGRMIAVGDVVVEVNSTKMDVWDMIRPANPQRVGNADDPAPAHGELVVSGGLAFAALGSRGLFVYDVSDAAAPFRMGVDETDRGSSIAVVGNHAYVAADTAGLVVVDVSEPATPRRSSAVEFDGFFAAGVAVSDNHAFVGLGTGRGDGSLTVVDVTDPANPERRGTVDLGRGSGAHIAVSGDFAYVDHGVGGLSVVDVSNPDRPGRVGGHERSGDIEIVGDLAYVADVDLIVFDISNPVEPRPLVEPPPKFRQGAPRFFKVAVAGDLAYVMDANRGLEVLDVSDPANPRRVSGNSTMIHLPSIAVVDGRVYTVGQTGLTILGLEFPFPPLDVVATAADGEVELSWIAPSGGLEIVGYNVFHVADDGSETLLNESPVTQTSFTATGLANGVEQCFVVESVDAGGSTSEAPLVCATPEPPPVFFRRGDCNNDGGVNLADAVFTLDWLFRGAPGPECLSALDANRDGSVNIADPIALLGFLFLGGPGPLHPFPDCGEGVTPGDGELGCGKTQRSCE